MEGRCPRPRHVADVASEHAAETGLLLEREDKRGTMAMMTPTYRSCSMRITIMTSGPVIGN